MNNWLGKSLAAFLCITLTTGVLGGEPAGGRKKSPAGAAAFGTVALPAHMLDWARKQGKAVPTGGKTTWTVTEDGVKITEEFQFDGAAKDVWAALPSIFAISKIMGGPIEVENGAKDTVDGPVNVEGSSSRPPHKAITGVACPMVIMEGKNTITYTIRIPRLKNYMFDKPVWLTGEKDDPRYKALQGLLRENIDEVLAAKEHLVPFFHRGNGCKGNWYWVNPAEPIVTLCWTLAFLEPEKAEALKAYLKQEYARYDPLKTSAMPLNQGVRREFCDIGALQQGGSKSDSRNLYNIYAAWEYVDKVAGTEAAKAMWPTVKGYLASEQAGFVWDEGEEPESFSLGGETFSALNCRLNGYLAYARLARLAGDKEGEALGTCLFARGLAVLHGLAWHRQCLVQAGVVEPEKLAPAGAFGTSDKFHVMGLPELTAAGPSYKNGFRNMGSPPMKFFVMLTPEIGQFLHDYCYEPVTYNTRWMMWKCPSIWLNRGHRLFWACQGENWINEPWVPWTTFLGLGLAVQPPPDELCWYVGDSHAKFGDMYYLQRLAIALRAFAVAPKAAEK